MLLKDLMSDWQISEQDIAEAISAAPNRRGRPKKADITEAAATVPPDAPEQAVVKVQRRGRPKKAETTEAVVPVPPDAPEQAVVKAQRRGRPKKAEITEAVVPVPPDAPEQAVVKPKRRGRPKKVVSESVEGEPSDIKLSPQDEALIEETISANDVSSLLEDEPQPRVCVAVCDFGKRHFDKVARKAMYYEHYYAHNTSVLAELKYDVPEKCREETFNPAYIHDIFNMAVLPRISSNKGKERLPLLEALQNIRRLNVVAHCHGGYVARQLEKLMDVKMFELGYSEKEQKQVKSQLAVLCYNPDCPKHDSGMNFISIESASDSHNEFQTYFREWLLMEPQDFGVCCLNQKWGKTLMCAQVDKAGIEGNPPRVYKAVSPEEWFEGLSKPRKKDNTIGEHDFLGFEPVGNMSRGALKMQKFANNILKNMVKNSQAQGGAGYIPLPGLKHLAAEGMRQKYEFARAVLTGYKLERKLMHKDLSRIDQYANRRRSIPQITLD